MDKAQAAYDWLAPKLSSIERESLDSIMATIAALREENARKDEALKEARGFVSWMIRRAVLSDEADQEKEGCKCLKVIEAAIASARSDLAGKGE